MTLCLVCAISCCQSVVRNYPTNYIVLFAFTSCEAVLVGIVSSAYTWQSVLLAFGATTAIFLGMTAYACLTKTDFTGCGPYLFAALLTLCAFGFVLVSLAMLGVKPEAALIVYDTQLVLGQWGGHKVEFGLDDYVFAALNLYLDIINLFLRLLRLFGSRD